MTKGLLESPTTLLGRLRLGREEFCQRLLTMLILEAPYPKWNSRNRPSEAGCQFLRRLDALSFGEASWDEEPVFVDEIELLGRTDDDKAGYPDWAALWPERTWIIELKTEKASHRPDQLPYYFNLGRHHYPTCAIDLTYLTPPMQAPLDPPGEWARYGHVTWDQLLDLIHETWGSSEDSAVRTIVDAVTETIEQLPQPSRAWRELWADRVHKPPEVIEPAPLDDIVARALELVDQTANDGKQRALEYQAPSLAALAALRVEVRDAICSGPDEARHFVMPWLWRWESLGEPLTAGGRETGFELRLSRYQKPIC
jgi:hypothetical protein